FGRLLPGRRRDALVALAASNAGIATAGGLVSVSSEHLRTARRVQVHAREHALEVARQLVSIHAQIKVLAADAYMLGSSVQITGPSRLTADDLVAYIDSLHLQPHLTVSLRTLADLFISEGNAEGVRGDVAFAQSILETGAFMYPGHGLVDPGDNNFAGIDACDSCKHGDLFESAQIGVRAQMQLLRIYADPSVKQITDLAHPLALLHEPRLGF